MTNSELAEWLNDELGLASDRHVTANVVRQWVNWNLLPKASIQGRESGKGPIWQRDNAAIKLARRLGEFRQCGLVTEKQLIARCYIDEWPINIDDARTAMLNRAQFARKRMSKKLTIDYSKLDGKTGDLYTNLTH